MKTDIDDLLAKIMQRYQEIRDNPSREKRFTDHIRSLGNWENQSFDEYMDTESPEYPETILIAFAICHETCGTREFIVEGSTQECQRCGRLMFRIDSREYRLR